MAVIDTKAKQDLVKALVKKHFDYFSTGNALFLIGNEVLLRSF